MEHRLLNFYCIAANELRRAIKTIVKELRTTPRLCSAVFASFIGLYSSDFSNLLRKVLKLGLFLSSCHYKGKPWG